MSGPPCGQAAQSSIAELRVDRIRIQYSGAASAFRLPPATFAPMPKPSPSPARLPPFRAWALGLALASASVWPLAARADDASEVRALLARGDAAAALQRVEKALVSRPRDTPLRFLQGVVLMDLSSDQQALALFTQLAQEHPDLPDPYNNIGLLQARAGRLDEALAALQEALRSDPGHRTARANLGQVYLMLAIRTWDVLAQTGPVDPALLRRLEAARSLAAGGSTATAAGKAAARDMER